MRVAAVPERGKANEALIRLLADALELRPAAVAIVSGHTGRDKTIEVTGAITTELEQRLSRAAEAG